MKRIMGIFILIPFILIGCAGKKEVKKESEEAKISKDAYAVVESLKNAYITKDLGAIERGTTKEGYMYVTKDIKKFDSAELRFKPVWVEIEAEKVILNISWQGRWYKNGSTNDEKGMAVFILRDKPLKVDRILRSNPFEVPE